VAKNPDIYTYDALGDFSLGVNSDFDPFIVPRNQMPFAVNATIRGNFIRNRPPYWRQSMVFPDDAVKNSVEKGLFQGACYYRPDAGSEMLVAQIGGKLFTFTPDANDTFVPVADVSIPGDSNPESLPQAWLRQAEKWVIVNNGQSTPIFFDGISSRRSIVDTSTNFARTTTGTFITPPINGTVIAVMNANYTGAINEAIQLVEYDVNGVVSSATTWEVVNVNGLNTTYSLILRNLGDVAGAVQGVFSPLLIQPGNMGNIISGSLTYTLVGTTYTTIRMTVVMSHELPATAAVGSGVSINGDASWKIASMLHDRKHVTFSHPNATVLPQAPAMGDYVILLSESAPNVVASTLTAPFTAPAVGSNVTAYIQSAFTYPVGQILFAHNKQYQVVSIPTPVPVVSPNVTLRNINDDRLGHTFNALALAPYNYTDFFHFPELPPGRMMDYGQGRVWESLTDGISFIAGDIVGGSAGSSAYNGRDAVLKVSENSYLAGGGAFRVPSNIGQITGMRFTSQLDASLGQGALMVVCPGGVFSCNAPVDRAQWQVMTNPILSESLIGFGGSGQNSTIVVNGDLFFRAIDGIRSLIMARREFASWGNTPISSEMSRVLDVDRPEGFPYVSAVQFDNRVLYSTASVQGPQGVYFQGLIALNLDPISSIQGKSSSVYDGLWTGLNVLQIIEGQFNGVHRCFAFTYSAVEKKIQLYEILKDGELDNGTTPITWSFESPVLFRDSQNKGFFSFTKLEDGEFYVGDVKPGQRVNFIVEYRPDFSACWSEWHRFYICNDPESTAPAYGSRLGLGSPVTEDCNAVTDQPSNVGRWFQMRFTFNGHCIFKGAKVAASLRPESQFTKPICNLDE
jgi:hypothetical protein